MSDAGMPERAVVAFTDIVGWTEHAALHGDAAARSLRYVHDEVVRSALQTYGGALIQFTGDGALMRLPDATSAVRFALSVQRDLLDRMSTDSGVRVRIGMHVGPVNVSGEEIFGSTVNAAARITDQAAPGQILVSAELRDEVDPAAELEFLDRGGYWLRGFKQRWRLHELLYAPEGPGYPAASGTPLIGREQPLADLRRLIGAARSGNGRAAVIAGEPGIGKTRLCQEVAGEAARRGFDVLVGRCYDGMQSQPYLPFCDIFEADLALAASVPDYLEQLGSSAAEVARLLPWLRRQGAEIPAQPTVPPEQDRTYLFVGLRDYLARRARPKPLLLVVEDLHWADEASLQLFCYLARSAGRTSYAVIATMRPDEPTLGAPYRSAVDELVGRGLVTSIELGGLEPSNVAELVAQLAAPARDDFVERIVDYTNGNPFFIEALMDHLAIQGSFDEGLLTVASDTDDPGGSIPAGLRALLTHRVERLSEPTRAVLTVAAVIGRGASYDVLEAMAGHDAETVMRAVEEGERSSLLRTEMVRQRPWVRFRHELIRKTFLLGLSAPRRQRLHLQAATAIKSIFAGELEEHAAELALHLLRAGALADPADIVAAVRLATEQAMRASAYEAALAHIESALEVLPISPRGRARLLYQKGLALRALGQWDRGMECWESALEEFETLGEWTRAASLAGELAAQHAWARRLDRAVTVAERGLAVLPHGPGPHRAILLAGLGLYRSMAGDPSHGEPLLDEAVAVASENDNSWLLGRVLYAKTAHHRTILETVRTRQSGELAVRVLRTQGALWEAAGAMGWMQFAALTEGDLAGVREIHAELEPLTARLGHQGVHLVATRNRALCDLAHTGDILAFEQFVADDMQRCLDNGWPFILESHVWRGLTAFWRGDWAAADTSLQQALELEEPGAWAGEAWSHHLLLRAAEGAVDDVRRLIAERTPAGGYTRGAHPLGEWLCITATAEAAFAVGDFDTCASLVEHLRVLLAGGSRLRSHDLRSVHAVAGLTCAAAGDRSATEHHFEAALVDADTMPVRIEQAEVRRLYAAALSHLGNDDDASRVCALVADAASRFEQLGMPRHAELARQTTRAPTYW